MRVNIKINVGRYTYSAQPYSEIKLDRHNK